MYFWLTAVKIQLNVLILRRFEAYIQKTKMLYTLVQLVMRSGEINLQGNKETNSVKLLLEFLHENLRILLHSVLAKTNCSPKFHQEPVSDRQQYVYVMQIVPTINRAQAFLSLSWLQ